MKHFRRIFLPWTAQACFPDQTAFLHWLSRRQKRWNHLRAVFLLLSTLILMAGFFLDRYPVLVLTIAPLSVVLLLSVGLLQMDRLLDGQNKSEPTTKE